MNKTYFTETNQYSNGNTPIAFTKEDGQLLLTIVDKN
jgi:hypothetical protein